MSASDTYEKLLEAKREGRFESEASGYSQRQLAEVVDQIGEDPYTLGGGLKSKGALAALIKSDM